MSYISKNSLITEAIKRLRPLANFGLIGDTLDGLTWHENESPPTIEEIEETIIIIESEMASNAYKEKRKAEYPSIGDQLDALYHSGAFPEEMAAKIREVKEKYPKLTN